MENLLTIQEVAQVLKLSRSTIYRLIDHEPGFPPVIKIGGGKRIAESDLKRYIENRRKAA